MPTETITLATTHHDPEGRLFEQTARMLPRLNEFFDGLVVHVTSTTKEPSASLLREAGADLTREDNDPGGLTKLGRPRRTIVERALNLGAQHLMFCDFDRVLHWAEFHPEELARVIRRIPAHDFVVLGRSHGAFASHPRCQRDTEAIINTVFAEVSGRAWDTGAGARGISRRAAAALLADCHDESVGVDVSWPLFLLEHGGFDVTYLPTEGMEFETPDRYLDEIGALGSQQAWVDLLDRDPHQWALRLEVARVEVEAIRR